MLIKLILGLGLILGSNFIGHQEKKTIWVAIQVSENPNTFEFEEKTIYERERTTGETILALSMISGGGVLCIWYIVDKEKEKSEKKGDGKNEKEKEEIQEGEED